MTLNVVYGITKALHWTSNWDYFINLSASDLPLISTVRDPLQPAWRGVQLLLRMRVRLSLTKISCVVCSSEELEVYR